MVLGAEALALDDDGFGVMEQAVEQRGSQGAVVVEDLGPVLVGAIGGDDGGAALVAPAEDLEERIGAELVDG